MCASAENREQFVEFIRSNDSSQFGVSDYFNSFGQMFHEDHIVESILRDASL